MTIFSRHPYSFLFAGAGAVLLTIVLSVNFTGAPVTPAPITYVSEGTFPVNPVMTSEPSQNAPTTQEQQVNMLLAQNALTSPQVSNSSQSTASSSTPAIQPATVQQNPPVDSSTQQLLQEVYSLIPSGVSLPPTTSHPQSPTQQALHAYGNEAGLAVLTFENDHADMATVLQTWISNRESASAIASTQSIATGLTQAGEQLEAIPDVPAAVQAANTALATSYRDTGTKLLAVLAAGNSDAALLSAIKTYNASADSFTSAYIALSNIFTLNTVTFSANEPGSAFQFPASGGL